MVSATFSGDWGMCRYSLFLRRTDSGVHVQLGSQSFHVPVIMDTCIWPPPSPLVRMRKYLSLWCGAWQNGICVLVDSWEKKQVSKDWCLLHVGLYTGFIQCYTWRSCDTLHESEQIHQWDGTTIMLGRKRRCDTCTEGKEEMDCHWAWRGKEKVDYLVGNEGNKVLTEEVNEAVPGPKNRSGNQGCQGLTVLV